MKKLYTLFALLATTSGIATADEQIRQIQEELRKRHMYFGEIDGQKTEQTTRALRHYQERKGFQATGEPDSATLGSLNISVAPASTQWPDIPVLKSDAARQMKEEDRKYLESLEAGGEGPGTDEGPPTEDSRPPEGAQPPTKETQPPSKEPQRSADGQKAPSQQPRASKRDSNAPPPPRKEATAERDVQASVLTERAEEFVRNYLDACETNKLSAETAYYADKVKYFDNGVVSKDFIQRDVSAFYKRWPQRSYDLLDFKVLDAQPDKTVVRFRIAFRYRSPQHTVAGKTDNVFTIARAGDQMKFTALREERARD